MRYPNSHHFEIQRSRWKADASAHRKWSKLRGGNWILFNNNEMYDLLKDLTWNGRFLKVFRNFNSLN